MIYNLKFHLKPAHLEPFIYWFHGIIRWWFLIFLYLAESDYPVPVCQNLSWVTILAVVSLGGLMIETVRYEAEWGKIKPDWGRGEIWDMPNIITMDWWAAIHHTGWEVINPLTPIILHHTGRTEQRILDSAVSILRPQHSNQQLSSTPPFTCARWHHKIFIALFSPSVSRRDRL